MHHHALGLPDAHLPTGTGLDSHVDLPTAIHFDYPSPYTSAYPLELPTIYGEPYSCRSREVRRGNLGWLLIVGRSGAETYVDC